MNKVLTTDFKLIDLPELVGTEKQIEFAKKIRDKYLEVFSRKLNDINIFEKEERKHFTEEVRDHVQSIAATSAKYWIDYYCPKCGCKLISDRCENEFCSYEKKNR